MSDKIVLVGNSNIIHIGSHLRKAAVKLGIETTFCDVKSAYRGMPFISQINWHFRGHRPNRLNNFSKEVLRACQETRPKWILSVGLAPINSSALAAIGMLGIKRLNYLTDDPWNPAHKSRYFLKALPCYDRVFSVRGSNMEELKNIGCRNVSYLPFGYDPELHFPQAPDQRERSIYECDIMFAGGADRDRVKFIDPLIKAGFKVALYGGYWGRFAETRACARGHIGPEEMRKAVSAAKVVLCLVRHANRDSNSMRTFEIPAIGGCMLTEDTGEHRRIFGNEGEVAAYFKNIDEIVQKTGFLIANEPERYRLAEKCHNLIVSGGNTYKDRLTTMLENICAAY